MHRQGENKEQVDIVSVLLQHLIHTRRKVEVKTNH